MNTTAQTARFSQSSLLAIIGSKGRVQTEAYVFASMECSGHTKAVTDSAIDAALEAGKIAATIEQDGARFIPCLYRL